MATKPLPLEFYFNGPIVDPKTGHATEAFKAYFSKNIEIKTATTLTLQGEFGAAAPIEGRTEGIATTAQHLTSAGALASTDNIAADGTGSPLTGGKRGFQALNSANRLASSLNNNPLNVSKCPQSATTLSNTGADTIVHVAANTYQFGGVAISYNSGSVDPGGIGTTFFISTKDPTFAGGAVTYEFNQTPPPQTDNDGRVNFGKIIPSAGATTGGGYTGGTTSNGTGGDGFNPL